MQKKSIAIISDSLAGPLLATLLESEGHTISLIELGDSFKSQKLQSSLGLPVIPATPLTERALAKLNEFSPAIALSQIVETAPMTFEDGAFKPFIGFGDSKSEALQPLTWLNVSKQIQLREPLEAQLEFIFSNLKAKVYNYSELSSIEFSGSKIEKILINGTQEILANDFIFMSSPKELFAHLPPEYVNSRTRSRLLKTSAWASVTLEIEHSAPLFDGANLIFLTPNQPDQDPCVGQCVQEQTPAGVRYSSVWETYINNNYGEDSEHISNIIRNMRKLIRRAFPNIENKSKESLTVTPDAAADYAWLLEQRDLLQLADNFVFYPNLASQYLGIAQCVVSAVSAYEALSSKSLNSQPDHTTPSLLSREASC